MQTEQNNIIERIIVIARRGLSHLTKIVHRSNLSRERWKDCFGGHFKLSRYLKSRNDAKRYSLFTVRRSYSLAFTLSEVIIVIGIIGVIVAMVIPAITANVTQKQNIVAWRKVYSTIDNAQRSMMNDNGGDLRSAFGTLSYYSPNFINAWLPYLRYVKKCEPGKAVTNKCHSGSIKALTDDYTMANWAPDCAALVLADGTVLLFYPGVCGDNLCGNSHIFIDVNGIKLPNRMGKDVFDINYNANKKIFETPLAVNPACNEDGMYCGQYYLLNN